MKIAVIDNDEISRKLLVSMLMKCKCNETIEVIDFKTTSIKLDDIVDKYNIIFIKIDETCDNGFHLARNYVESNSNGLVIIITNDSKIITKALRLNVFQILLFPFDVNELEIDLKRAEKIIKKNKNELMIKWKKELFYIKINDIDFIESDNRKLLIHVKDEIFQYTQKLSNLYEEIKDHGFALCHKSYLVNLNNIIDISNQKIFLDKGIEVPISKRYKKEFYNEYRRYFDSK